MRFAFAIASAAALLAGCGGSGSAGSALDPAKAAPLVAQLPAPFDTGDPVAGQKVFALCSSCHTLNQGGPNMTGPNLSGLFGRVAGSKADYKYSQAMKATGWTWDAEKLDHWMANPQTALPGSKMVFVGVSDAGQRRNLIAYLKVVTTPAP